MAKADTHGFGDDPRAILDLPEEAGEADIRRAYLEKIKVHSPDRDPEMFEKVRDAYELLRDPRKRTTFFLKNIDPEAPFVSLLKGASSRRRKVGLKPWLGVIKDQRPEN